MQHVVPDYYSYATAQEMHLYGDPATSLFLKADLLMLCDVLTPLKLRDKVSIFSL